MEIGHTADSGLIRDSKYTGPKQSQPTIAVPAALWHEVLAIGLNATSGTVGDALAVTMHADGGATFSGDHVDLVFSRAEMEAFAKGVADGEFDRR